MNKYYNQKDHFYSLRRRTLSVIINLDGPRELISVLWAPLDHLAVGVVEDDKSFASYMIAQTG